MKQATTYWDEHFMVYGSKKPVYDLWLKKYDSILQTSIDIPIVDLGCGLGNDTLYLHERGYKVISCDFSIRALERLGAFIRNPITKLFDMAEGLPFAEESARIIVADLSLHYFSWLKTQDVLAEIKRVLTPDGYLLARVNSVKDVNHGAGQGEAVEENFYRQDGRYKRFFTKEQLNGLFKEWNLLSCAEQEMNRYKNTKILWELAVQKI
jgi:SAM-dependent methyltransferase